MKFVSTRDKKTWVSGQQAIVQGISEEGGLFVPECFPRLKPLGELLNLSYQELAYEILALYFEDLGETSLQMAVDAAYDEKFPNEVVPMHSIGNSTFLELFHGRTLAFKDMALSILPHLMKASAEGLGEEREIIVLVATSGDTGKAALEGFSGAKGIEVSVFYPDGGVSEMQRLQMVTTQGENTYVCGIRGNFDDAQTGVKKIFADPSFTQEVMQKGYILSSANSINIGRLIPQIVYYVYGYLQLLKEEKIKGGEKIHVCVPTGNFGNVLAAYYAKEMGLPLDRLIVASNDNRVLTDFFSEGIYDGDRPLYLTSSPSMDILISSNLERFIYHSSNEDAQAVMDAMDSLKQNRRFDWQSQIKDPSIYAYMADEEAVSKSIRELYLEHGYVMDPHTAVANSAVQQYRSETGDSAQILIASTASPFKFAGKVLKSIGHEVPQDEFKAVEDLAQLMEIPVPTAVQELLELEERHRDLCQPEEMEEMLCKKYLRGTND